MDHSVWEEVYQRFDPEKPAQKAEWRALRPQGPSGDILKNLEASFDESRILLIGTIGTGKTTELLQIAEQRATEDFVVILDLVQHFGEVVGDAGALQQIAPWEVCFLSALAVIRAAEDWAGHQWAQKSLNELGAAWSDIAGTAYETPTPDIDIADVAKSVALLGSMVVNGSKAMSGALQQLASIVKWKLPLGLGKKSLPDQDGKVRRLLNATNHVIGELQQTYGRRVLLVIDGLDRVKPERASELFVDSDLIGRMDCREIVTAPFRHSMELVAIRQFEPFTLVNVPVLDQKNPSIPGEGIEFFYELFAKRTKDLTQEILIGGEDLKKLAYYSGGRARDFVRAIRMLARRCYVAESEQASSEQIDEVLREARLLLEQGLNRGDIDLLRMVQEDKEHRLPDDERIWALLNLWRLLPYPNESEWYYPHPLLTLGVLKTKTG